MNSSLLRLFTPSKNYIWHSIRLGFVLSALSIIVASLLTLILLYYTNNRLPEKQTNTVDLYGSVIIAPILETILISIIHYITVRNNSKTEFLFLLLVVVFAFLGHLERGYWAIIAALAFAFFSLQYIAFHKTQGVAPAIIGVTLTHSINNGVAMAVALLILHYLG